MSINRVILVGRLTKEPTLRKTQSGTSVTSFTIACNRRVAQGQEPQADYINCVAWNNTADVVAKYTNKGSLVGVEGRIQTRNYDDAQGKRVYITEVVCDSVQFLESKNSKQQNTPSQEYSKGYETVVPSPYSNSAPLEIAPDDLPF